jgi:hypothetical protein
MAGLLRQEKKDRPCDLSPKNGIAPRAALLTARWGDERRRKAPALLYIGSGAYVHRITVGSRVFDFSLPASLCIG